MLQAEWLQDFQVFFWVEISDGKHRMEQHLHDGQLTKNGCINKKNYQICHELGFCSKKISESQSFAGDPLFQKKKSIIPLEDLLF